VTAVDNPAEGTGVDLRVQFHPHPVGEFVGDGDLVEEFEPLGVDEEDRTDFRLDES